MPGYVCEKACFFCVHIVYTPGLGCCACESMLLDSMKLSRHILEKRHDEQYPPKKSEQPCFFAWQTCFCLSETLTKMQTLCTQTMFSVLMFMCRDPRDTTSKVSCCVEPS